jgi:hypothetical protein
MEPIPSLAKWRLLLVLNSACRREGKGEGGREGEGGGEGEGGRGGGGKGGREEVAW